jgi:hypothetical protein
MVCIAAFIVLCILGIFSARYRALAAEAWGCVAKRITFRPCDVNFGERIKGKILGKIVLSHPRTYRLLSKWFDFLAFVFVILTIWSLLYVVIAGMNYIVYDTCNPQNSQSCSLGGEACSIGQANVGFIGSIATNQELTWAKTEWTQIGTTISLLPSAFKDWKATDYISADNTYYNAYSQSKPTALEIIDPGCVYCGKLFANIKTSGFENKYNLTYILYPIPDAQNPNGYKFANSYLMASYVEAAKSVQPANPVSSVAPDWQLLEKIYTEPGAQSLLDYSYNSSQTTAWLQQSLKEIGYSDQQIAQIATDSGSPAVQQAIATQRSIVEKKIQTVKIPTIIFGGHRFERVIDASQLK